MRRPDELADGEATDPNAPPPTPHRHRQPLPTWAELVIAALGLGLVAVAVLFWVTRSTASAKVDDLERRLGELCAVDDVRPACTGLPPTVIVNIPTTGAQNPPASTASSAATAPAGPRTTDTTPRPSSSSSAPTAPPPTSTPASSTTSSSSSTSTTRRTILPPVTLPLSSRRAVTGRALVDELGAGELALIVAATVAGVVLVLLRWPRP